MGKVIYEKNYPREDPEEEMEKIKSEALSDSDVVPPFEEFLKEMYENRVYVLMPERTRTTKCFIQAALEISELYEMDTKITEHFDHISVDYSFAAAGGMRYLREVVKYADEISFFVNSKNYEITISLDFYTHRVFYHGRQLHP